MERSLLDAPEAIGRVSPRDAWCLRFSGWLLLAVLTAVPIVAQGRQVPVRPASAAGEPAPALLRHDGFIPFVFDATTGKMLLEVSRFNEPFLLLTALSAGGLDTRLWWDGWPWSASGPALVHFERRDSRVLLVARDVTYRPAGSSDDALRSAVDWAFVPSVVAAMPVVNEDAGRVLVDATDFLLRDALEVGAHFSPAGGATARYDRQRSAIDGDISLARPDATEIETRLTFAVSNSGRSGQPPAVSRPTLTVRQRHSFVPVPQPGFQPREADERLGFYKTLPYIDFTRTVDRGYQGDWIHRWRLAKRDPQAPLSAPIEPIVFYLDAAIPSRYRPAVIEAVEYWNDAFRSAGFDGAIRTEDLPPAADVMDLRYRAVILWSPAPGVESSYTSLVSDPRTGEILKAVVYLDAYRDQVWFNIFAAVRPALGDTTVTAEQFVGVHRRFVVTHEMGHALALMSHNDASASTLGFPVPQLYPNDDGTVRVDLSRASYAEPTSYDRWMIRYAYAQPAPDDDPARMLRSIVDEGVRNGLRFIDDSAVQSNPLASGRLADEDRIAEVERARAVRLALLAHLDESTLQPGEPMQLLLARLFPVYFHHRFAIEAALKVVGGMEYSYAARGDGQMPTRVIDPDTQRRALNSVLGLLAPGELRIPERIVRMIPPVQQGRPAGPSGLVTVGPRNIRYMTGESGPILVPATPGAVVDPLGWARTLSRMVIDPLLQPERAARVVSFHARNPESPALEEVLQRIIDATWMSPRPADGMDVALWRVAQRVVLDGLLKLAQSQDSTPDVRAAVLFQLDRLSQSLMRQESPDAAGQAHLKAALRDIAGCCSTK